MGTLTLVLLGDGVVAWGEGSLENELIQHLAGIVASVRAASYLALQVRRPLE
jgi:hypothetical protein